MKKSLAILFCVILSVPAQEFLPSTNTFMQGNNINTCFRTNGVYNYDWETFIGKEAGFIWPANSTNRKTAVFTSGIWIGAKVGPQRELRVAASFYGSHFSPGNIPVIGQVPPSSVCNDPSWRGYYVQLTDPSLTNGGVRTKWAGGSQYTFTYDSWANWPVSKGAPYVEVNGIPGYQPSFNGDRPGIGNGMKARPEELLFMVYMDYTNCTNNIHASETSLPGGSLPLGVEIQQLAFMFNCPPLRDMYFTKFRIINKSSNLWDSVYVTSSNDPDIGGYHDEPAGCDSTRDLAFQHKMDSIDNIYGANPPAFGTRLLQTPVFYTGLYTDSAKLPYDTLIGYLQRGMSSFNTFTNSAPDPCENDPYEYTSGYKFMKGLNGCGFQLINWVTNKPTKFRYSGDACRKIGWFDSTEIQRRYIQNTGPFKMNSGDTQIIVMSYMITRDGGNNLQNVCALQSISDSAYYHYYHDFQSCVPIGIEPINTEIPTKFELFQNYPNPFNPTTKIRFNIPKAPLSFGEGLGVGLRIYDVLGKEIAVVVNENLKPGIYEIEWNAENIPSGVYFYSLITNNFTQTRKLIVIK